MTPEALSELIESAALDVSLWPQVLAGLAASVGAEGAALIYQNQADGQGASIISGIDPAATPLYFGDYAINNPLQRAGTLREKVDAFQPRVLNDEHLLAKTELTRSDFYNGLLRPFDMHSILMIGLGMRGENRIGVNLVRGTRKPQFDSEEIEVARHWHAPLIHAFGVGMSLAPMTAINADLSAVLDTLADAVFVVDAELRVMFRNRRANELAASGVVGLFTGRLRARHCDDGRRLEALVARATHAHPPVGGVMAMIATGGRRPLSLTVTPLSSPRRALFDAPVSAMVRIRDLEAPLHLTEHLLAEVFGLTRAEARVTAALAEGLAPREIGERLGVSFNTVRAQLANIFEKTGVSRQADLMRLVSRVADDAN